MNTNFTEGRKGNEKLYRFFTVLRHFFRWLSFHTKERTQERQFGREPLRLPDLDAVGIGDVELSGKAGE